MSSESITEFLEYIQRIGMHISRIYHQLQLQEVRGEALLQELQRIRCVDRLPRNEFIALARGVLCPSLHEKWRKTQKFLAIETPIAPSRLNDHFIKEITPRTNPDAQAILDKATALDCDWAKHIILKSEGVSQRSARLSCTK